MSLPEPLSEEELIALFESASPRGKLLMSMYYSTGVRPSSDLSEQVDRFLSEASGWPPATSLEQYEDQIEKFVDWVEESEDGSRE